MASMARPMLLRRVCLAAPPARSFSTHPPTALKPCTASSPPRPLSFPRQSNFLLRDLAAGSTRVAAFHASQKQSILPVGPQHIEGTGMNDLARIGAAYVGLTAVVNDPAPVPSPSPTHGSYHWTFDRLISVALVPLTIAPFAAGSLNPVTDALLCATLLIHSHIGFESYVIDYIPKRRYPTTRAIFWWGLRGATLLVAVGLYEFETNDVGLTEAIKRVWTA